MAAGNRQAIGRFTCPNAANANQLANLIVIPAGNAPSSVLANGARVEIAWNFGSVPYSQALLQAAGVAAKAAAGFSGAVTYDYEAAGTDSAAVTI